MRNLPGFGFTELYPFLYTRYMRTSLGSLSQEPALKTYFTIYGMVLGSIPVRPHNIWAA